QIPTSLQILFPLRHLLPATSLHPHRVSLDNIRLCSFRVTETALPTGAKKSRLKRAAPRWKGCGKNERKRMFEIRPYEPQRDALRVYTLWQHTLGQLWPLPYETFHSVTVDHPAYRQGDHFVAVSGDEIVGWIATQMSSRMPSSEGNLL